MRRSTLVAVLVTATILVIAGRLPSTTIPTLPSVHAVTAIPYRALARDAGGAVASAWSGATAAAHRIGAVATSTVPGDFAAIDILLLAVGILAAGLAAGAGSRRLASGRARVAHDGRGLLRRRHGATRA